MAEGPQGVIQGNFLLGRSAQCFMHKRTFNLILGSALYGRLPVCKDHSERQERGFTCSFL